jgi:hypothetical protein
VVAGSKEAAPAQTVMQSQTRSPFISSDELQPGSEQWLSLRDNQEESTDNRSNRSSAHPYTVSRGARPLDLESFSSSPGGHHLEVGFFLISTLPDHAFDNPNRYIPFAVDLFPRPESKKLEFFHFWYTLLGRDC